MKAKIINASAGTGKTYTMAIEYLKALNRGIKYEEIQVITFTKKATAEIKERVLQFLSDIIFKENNYLSIIKSMDVEINYDLLNKVYFDMLKNSENIKISTNDAFINKIFNLAISPYKNVYSYEVLAEEEDSTIQMILEKLIENDYEEFKELYLFNGKKKIDELKDILKNSIIKNRNVLYSLINKENKNIHIKKQDFKLIKEDILKSVFEYRDIVFKNEYRGKLNIFDVNKNLILKLENTKNIVDIIDDVFNKFKNKSYIGITYVKREDPLYKIASKINEIVENNKEKIFECYLEDVIYKYNIIYRKIAKKVYDYLEEINFKTKKFTFSDILFYTDKFFYDIEIGLVKNNYAQDKLYEIIGSKIRVFMIDEFQDTDNVQLKIFMPLLKNCDEILIVGDYKQAIYGFRGANSSIFRNIQEILQKNIENIEIENKNLSTCYRTRAEIINYVNSKFKNLENYKYEDVDFIKEKGYVEIIEVEKDEIFRSIASKIKDQNSKNSAILFNTNLQISKMSQELYKNNIEYSSIESMNLIKDKNIGNIKLLIDYLVSKDTYKLLEFLRSDLIKMSIDDIKKFVKNKLEDNYIIKNIRILEKDSTDFKRKYIDFFGYNENMSDDDILNINIFLDLIENANNLKDFYNNYDKILSGIKKVNSKNNEATNILTIHSSKGLEYDDIHLFYDFKKDNLKNFKLSYKRENNEIVDFLFIKKRAIIEKTKVGKEFLEYFQDDEIENAKNLAYVGLTRPKDNLYVYFVNSKNKEDDFLNLNEEKRGELLKFKEKKEKNNNENLLFNNLEFFTKTEYEPKENALSSNIFMELKRKKGLALHYYMEYIKDESDKEYAKSMLYKRYANLIGPNEIQKIIEKSNQFIDNNKDIYNIKKYEVHNEFNIINNESEIYRLDRINIDHKNKKIIIYDYKTENNAENFIKYKKQIYNYKKIIENKEEYKGYNVSAKIISIDLN